jgi:hypothetical protein
MAKSAVAARSEVTGTGTGTTQPRVNKPRFDLWKPNKEAKGAGAIFQVAQDNTCFFLTMMPETGQEQGPKFDNSKSITVKLGRNDVGELLTVLTGKVEGLGKKNDKGYWSGLYHQSSNGNSAISLSKGTYGYILSVSVKRDEIEARYNVGITLGEAELLRVYFEMYSRMFYEAVSVEN